MAVDGDWGNGSRRAMEAYYGAKKLDVGEVEPTESVYLALAKEPARTCDAPAAVVKKDPVKASAKTTTKKAAPKKATTKKATTTKKAAPKKAATAPKKDGVTCKFLVIAVVCS